MKTNIKKHVKALLAFFLMLAIVLQSFAGVKLGTKAADTGYQEMKFGDWETSEGSVDYMGYPLNLYSLPNDSELTSLDGVAISGKVNFNGTTRQWISIGGTSDVKNGGFWLGANTTNCWVLSCQGIGENYNEEAIWNEAAKFESEVELRLTFDKATDSDTWTVKVYADGTEVGTYTYSDVTPGLYIGLPEDVTVDMTPSLPQSLAYEEMKFGDWGTSEGSVDYMGYPLNLYCLTDSSKITSLDGVAINGKVNFNGTYMNWITIGGTADVKNGGFWLGAVQENGWAMACQGIGTGYGETVSWNEAAKFNGEVELRLTFDKAKKSDLWVVRVYADNTEVGTWTYSGVTPGLYIGIPEGVTVDMTSSTPQTPDYQEMKFSDWGKYEGTVGSVNIFSLTDSTKITSLDGVAISGKVDFNGQVSQYITIGGTANVKNGGFWLRYHEENALAMACQGVGANAGDTAFWTEATKFTEEVELRLTFDKATNSDTNVDTWTVNVYAGETLVGTWQYENVTPGLYIGVDVAVTVEGLDTTDSGTVQPTVPEFADSYQELSFSDFGMYRGLVEGSDIYSLKGHSDIESLDGVAVSGKVNFNDADMGMIRVGGTEQLKHAGFWLFNDGECLRLSPQGIGADSIDHHVMWQDAWVSVKNTEIVLRMTFNQEPASKEWWVGIYINEEKTGLFNCGVVEPGMYLGVDPTVTVEGLGDIVKNSGLDFTLFGYSNKNWRKEMGLD